MSRPVLILCLRATDPWPPRRGIHLEDGYCKICGYPIRYDPELGKEIIRKYPAAQRVCLECGTERLKDDEKPDIDLAMTADYLRRRYGGN